MSGRIAVGGLVAVLWGLFPSTALGQSSLSLDDFGVSPIAPRTPAQRLEACLGDPSACARQGQKRLELSIENVVNLGIVDRQPGMPQPASGGATARSIKALPSIDMSAYLVGEAPERTRRAELGELSALLAREELAGYRVSIVITGADDRNSATERAKALADAISGMSGVTEGRVTVSEAGTAPEPAGEPRLTLVLIPLD
ncbi:hypothetical protein [Aquibium sp. ELW1220]|uniref:hypothetical protein n=1 Tax=Aquibium sp. ELW1220 TaxID=2976766 RepID=UPI0025B27653|nr:hypothetical protein [Aquibium sp. ELW1220]MDN2582999.1 hypothetical protein [Aquibium sp. ELW1220]